jgi:hypothetical protein
MFKQDIIGKNNRGVSIIIQDRNEKISKSFTVHNIDFDTLFSRIKFFCENLSTIKTGEFAKLKVYRGEYNGEKKIN